MFIIHMYWFTVLLVTNCMHRILGRYKFDDDTVLDNLRSKIWWDLIVSDARKSWRSLANMGERVLCCSLDPDWNPDWNPQGFLHPCLNDFCVRTGPWIKAGAVVTLSPCAVTNHGEPALFKDLHWCWGGRWVIGSAGVQCSTCESQREIQLVIWVTELFHSHFLLELIMEKGTESPSATLSSEVILLGETWRDNDHCAFKRGGHFLQSCNLRMAPSSQTPKQFVLHQYEQRRTNLQVGRIMQCWYAVMYKTPTHTHTQTVISHLHYRQMSVSTYCVQCSRVRIRRERERERERERDIYIYKYIWIQIKTNFLKSNQKITNNRISRLSFTCIKNLYIFLDLKRRALTSKQPRVD